MFSNLVDLFDASSRKWVWITEKPHETGSLKNYAIGPFCRPEHVQAHELDKLPFRHVLVGLGAELCPKTTGDIDRVLLALATAREALADAPRVATSGQVRIVG